MDKGEKISVAMIEYFKDPEFRERHRNGINAAWTEKRRKEASERTKLQWANSEFKHEMSEKFTKIHNTEEAKRNHSEAALRSWRDSKGKERLMGERNGAWKGGKSFEPYGVIFNDQNKESIRNRDNRCCTMCGKSEILNGKKLTIHHVDGDKRSLWWAAVCFSCNTKANWDERFEFVIAAKNWRFIDWFH